MPNKLSKTETDVLKVSQSTLDFTVYGRNKVVAAKQLAVKGLIEIVSEETNAQYRPSVTIRRK